MHNPNPNHSLALYGPAGGNLPCQLFSAVCLDNIAIELSTMWYAITLRSLIAMNRFHSPPKDPVASERCVSSSAAVNRVQN